VQLCPSLAIGASAQLGPNQYGLLREASSTCLLLVETRFIAPNPRSPNARAGPPAAATDWGTSTCAPI